MRRTSLREQNGNVPNRSRSNSSSGMGSRRSSSSSRSIGDKFAMPSSMNRTSRAKSVGGKFYEGRPSSGYGRSAFEGFKDKRPLGDKAYREECIIELIQFLNQHEYPHEINVKMLLCPQQKDYLRIFQFLYQFLDPTFVLSKRPEEDIPPILKGIGYPFTITKTSLISVGSMHTWPNLLGILVWLRSTIISYLEMDIEEMVFPNGEDEFHEDIADRVKAKKYFCLEKCYRAFREGLDEYDEIEEEYSKQMCATFNMEELDAQLQPQLSVKKALQESLKQDTLEKNKKKSATLNEDCDVMANWVTKMKAFKDRRELTHEKLERNIRMLETEGKKCQSDVERKEKIINSQEMSSADLEMLTSRKQELLMHIENFNEKNLRCQQDLDACDLAIAKLNDEIKKDLEAHNECCRALELIPVSQDNGLDVEMPLSLLSYKTDSLPVVDDIKRRLTEIKTRWLEDKQKLNTKRINEAARAEKISMDNLNLKSRIQTAELQLTLAVEERQSKRETEQKKQEAIEAEIKEAVQQLTELSRNKGVTVQDAKRKLEAAIERIKKDELEQLRIVEELEMQMVEKIGLFSDHVEKTKLLTDNLHEEIKHKVTNYKNSPVME